MQPDLSTDAPAAVCGGSGLTPAQLEAFHRDGFVGPIDVLDDAGVARARAALDALLPRLGELEPELYEVEAAWSERPDEVVCHFLGGWLVEPVLRELVFHPAITTPCADALGVDRLRFWHDQVFYKPAGHPGVVPWHQDESYWTRTAPANHVTLNLLLDDADDASGCLMFVPGSHRFGLLPPLPFDSPLEAIAERLTPEQRAAFRPWAVPVRAGQATLHHCRTLHGSGPNRSSRSRRALVFNYMGPDTRVADPSGAPLLRGVAPLPFGALVEGPHFPIVLDRRAGAPGGA
ncbi:MAG: phytanoyl-CoA dioxygenase family protein [Planctomycetes bacterium]|nr:phytanoyl-CoA dioxygenase family protein [Planctomycetota bacterium]